MARLVTTGFETKDGQGSSYQFDSASPFAAPQGSTFFGTWTYDTSIFRSGAVSRKASSGAGNATAASAWSSGAVASLSVYVRAYFQFTNLPASAVPVLAFSGSSPATTGVGIKVTAAGAFQLWNLTAATQIGSDSGIACAAGDGLWYRLELKITCDGSSLITGCEAMIDGVSFASTTGLSLASSNTSPRMGWLVAPGANKVLYIDDVAVNDSSGAAQNTWPGDGKIVLLLPTSDNAAGSWKAGSAASAVSNGALFEAINNTPPVGTATPNAATAAISNNVSGATLPNGDFNMTTYSAAGIGAGDTINLVLMLVSHGEDVATGAKTGTFKILSNPDSGTADTIGLSGVNAFGTASACGTWSTNWTWQKGAVVYAPSVTVGTAPVCRVTKTDTGTRAADICFVGLYVDYTPAPAGGGGDGERDPMGMLGVFGI